MSRVTAEAGVAQAPPQGQPLLAAPPRGARRPHTIGPIPVAMVTLVAWALLVAAELTGATRHMDHDAVLEGGVPPLVAVGLFLASWLVMIVATMVPATLPALRRSPIGAGHAGGLLSTFLAGFIFVWLVAGSTALGLDLVLHTAAQRVPSLEARPWVVTAGLLAATGAIQLAPSTRRHLARCSRVSALNRGAAGSAFVAGSEHGARCLRADGPLMLVMFAAGGKLGWMVVLTAVMTAERSPRAGRHVAIAAGLALLVGAAVVLTPAWLSGRIGTLR